MMVFESPGSSVSDVAGALNHCCCSSHPRRPLFRTPSDENASLNGQHKKSSRIRKVLKSNQIRRICSCQRQSGRQSAPPRHTPIMAPDAPVEIYCDSGTEAEDEDYIGEPLRHTATMHACSSRTRVRRRSSCDEAVANNTSHKARRQLPASVGPHTASSASSTAASTPTSSPVLLPVVSLPSGHTDYSTLSVQELKDQLGVSGTSMASDWEREEFIAVLEDLDRNFGSLIL